MNPGVTVDAQTDQEQARSHARSRRNRDDLQLAPFAKAYSGLTDEEFRRVDGIIRRNNREVRAGAQREAQPGVRLGFEGINRSSRHRSGIAVRFPRMLRIRHDKPLHEANTLADLELLLAL